MESPSTSEPEYTVYDWLNDYTVKLNDMTPDQKAEELRENYHESDQAYCDYLDYVEEWQWHAREQKQTLIQAFLYNMAVQHQRYKCKCGNTHTFTTAKEEALGDTVIDSPQATIYATCWYKQIAKDAEEVLAMCAADKQLTRLPTVIEQVMIHVVHWRMVDASLTPILLPFEAFKKVWWQNSSRSAQTHIARELLSQLTTIERNAIRQKSEQNVVRIPTPQWKKLLDFPHSDHGLHNLRHALSDAHFQEVWSFINRWRSKVGKHSDTIALTALKSKMETCDYCKRRDKSFQLKPSVLGIYYAPPGLGKTTTMDKDLLIAFDTDWIGIGPTWIDYSPLLNLGIPIVTNQYTAFIGCGLKIIGVIGPQIRKDTHGNPFTTMGKLKKYQIEHPKEVYFIQVTRYKYLAHYIARIQMLHSLQALISNYAINLLPFYNDEQSLEWIRKYPKLLRIQNT